MPRFRLCTPCSIFLHNFVISQEVFMMTVSYSVNEQIIFVMPKRFSIQINFKRCLFAKEEVDFVGYVVSKNGIKPQNIKTIEILEFQTPSKTSELKRFLGMASFFRKFADNFLSKASVLDSMLKRNQQVYLDY